jgi:hypothetical protein
LETNGESMRYACPQYKDCEILAVIALAQTIRSVHFFSSRLREGALLIYLKRQLLSVDSFNCFLRGFICEVSFPSMIQQNEKKKKCGFGLRRSLRLKSKCLLFMLDMDRYTTCGLKRRIAEYVDVPMGAMVSRLRLAHEHWIEHLLF